MGSTTQKSTVKAVMAFIVVLLAVTGCGLVDRPSSPPVLNPPGRPFKPTSLPTTTPATPTPLTPEQAAVKLFYELQPVQDRVAQGKAKPEALKVFLTGEILQRRLNLYGVEWKQLGWVKKGNSKHVWVKVDRVLKVGGRRSVDVSRCMHVRPVDVVDATGKSIVAARRIPVVLEDYRVVEIKPNVWRVSESFSEGVKKCAA